MERPAERAPDVVPTTATQQTGTGTEPQQLVPTEARITIPGAGLSVQGDSWRVLWFGFMFGVFFLVGSHFSTSILIDGLKRDVKGVKRDVESLRRDVKRDVEGVKRDVEGLKNKLSAHIKGTKGEIKEVKSLLNNLIFGRVGLGGVVNLSSHRHELVPEDEM